VASLMENLIDVLEKECSEYEVLLALSRKKTPIIVGGNLEELQKITDEEQLVVSRIGGLEKTRTQVMKDIANVMNRDVTQLKLTNLIQMLASRPAESGKLAELHDRLKNVTANMQRVNEQNRQLIENALEMVEFDMNLLQSVKTAPETANYNKGAYTSGALMGVGRSGFDAKQ